MIKLYLKKAFLDGWDHILVLILMNFIYVLFLAVEFWLFSKQGSLFRCLSVVSVLFLSTLSLGFAGMTYQWSIHEENSFNGFTSAIRKKYKHAVLFSFLIVLIAVSVFSVIPSVFSSGNVYGLIVCTFLVWIVLILISALQFYYPLALYNGSDTPFKTLMKCIALVLGSPGFCAVVFLRTLFDFVVSIPVMFLAPGFTGVSISHMDAVRLLIVKFTWKREHGIKIKKSDYDEMLEKEKAFTGKRTFRELFMPWKKEDEEIV